MRARGPAQVNRRDPVKGVGTCKHPVKGEVPRSCHDPGRNDVNAVAIVIERCLIQQRRADHVSGVNDGAIRGIAKGVVHGRNVVPAPLRGSVAL